MPPNPKAPALTQKDPALTPLEDGYLLLSLAVLAGALCPFFYDLTGDHDPGFTDVNPIRLLTTLIVFLISGVMLLRRMDVAALLARRYALIVAVFTLPLLSVLWSVDPSTTFRRASAYFLTGVFCFYLRARLTRKELLQRLVLVFLIGAIASFAYALLVPRYGIHHGAPLEGTWKGVYGHKNDLGRICALAILISFLWRPETRNGAIMRIATIVLSFGLVFLSDSHTNWLILLGCCGIVPIISLLRTQKLTLALRLSIVAVVGASLLAVVMFGGTALLAMMGRDTSFSGRQTLWHAVIEITQEHYLPLGAGYGAFFTEAGGINELRPYLRFFGILPNHSHSGYINTLAELGIPGVALLALFMVRVFYVVTRRLIREPADPSWVAFALIAFVFAVNNFSETVAFKHSDIAWALLALCYLYAYQPAEAAAFEQPKIFGDAGSAMTQTRFKTANLLRSNAG